MSDPTPRRVRWRFPAVLIALAVGLYALSTAWARLEWNPDYLFPVLIAFQLSVMACLFLLPLWWVFFSGLRWRVRLAGVAVMAAAVGVAAATVRKVEYTGDNNPIVVWRWTPDPEARLAEHLAAAKPADGLPPIDLTIDPERDFPRYRGLNNDGVVRGVKLSADWAAKPPKMLWKHPCGGGYSGFAVAGNVLVTVEQRGDREAVVCYDRATGRERWAAQWEAHFQATEAMGGDGPRSTPTVHDGDVYAVGATGRLVRLDGKTGTEKWAVNVIEDNRSKIVGWGVTGSPLVVDDAVVVNPGADPDNNAGQALAAYDRATGKRLWAAGKHGAGYSSPQLSVVGGKRQILLFDAGGVAGFDPAGGDEWWRYPWDTPFFMNIIQPLVLGGDRVFVSSTVSPGSVMLKVTEADGKWSAEPAWSNKTFGAYFCNPVEAGGFIYGLSGNILACLDAKTGKRKWKDGRFGNGQMLLVGDKLLVLGEAGELALVAASPDGFKQFGKLDVFQGKTWNTPALAGDKLYVRTHTEMACFELAAE